MQFMIRPMNFRVPTDEDIHTAFKQGEAAVVALFHDVATQMSELAQQVAKQGEILQELQARLAKSSRTSSQPVWSKNLNACFPQRLRTCHHLLNVLISP